MGEKTHYIEVGGTPSLKLFKKQNHGNIINIASTAGREDYVQVRLEQRDGELWAVPVFGKSNLIYTLVHADGVVKIDLNANGVREGAWVTVFLH